MRNILSLVVVLMAIGTVNANGMNEPASPTGMSVVKSGDIVKVYYKGEHAGVVKLSIHDAKGNVVFRETIREAESFMRPYNFEPLPDGAYTIVLRDEQGRLTKTVSHEEHEKSSRMKERVAHLGRLGETGNKYFLMIPNKGEDVLTVKIFNSRNEVLHQRTEKVQGDFARLYNFNDIKGVCKFVIRDQAGNYTVLTKQ